MAPQDRNTTVGNRRDGGTQTSAMASAWPHQREPRMFTGEADEDVEEWLKHYQRVSKYNRWDEAMQLANVFFSLDGTALTWFENHEAAFTTWGHFVDEIKKSFGDPISRKKKAEKTLAQRAQMPGETCTTYIEEVLKLCSLASPEMSDEDKVGHLLKGIAEDVYNFLITKEDLASATDVTRHCRAFEALKTRRITPKFGRLANVTTVASIDTSSSEDIAGLVRKIIREELGQQFQKASLNPTHRPCFVPDSMHDQCAIQQEHSPPQPAESWSRQSYRYRWNDCHDNPRTAATFQPLTCPPRFEHDEFPNRPRPGYYRFQNSVISSNAYLGSTQGPKCYNCGVRGHISRFCQRRQQRDSRPPPRFATGWRNTTRYPPAAPHDQPAPPSMMRHGSPVFSDRSLSPVPGPARSPSPRRRSSPPPRGN